MAEVFNPYHEWLGLSAEAAEPSYYQLLGLTDLEPDAEKIAVAGDRAATRVRSFRPGGHAKEWSRLLDEIFSAKNCLLEPGLKADYDRRLVEKKANTGRARAVEADRYPPGMAPPGARTSAAAARSAPEEPQPQLPPTVNAPEPARPAPEVVPQVAAAAAPTYAAPLAVPLTGYPAAYPMSPAAGMYPAPLTQPYGAQPYAGQPYMPPAYSGAMLPYGAGPLPVPPPAPPPQVEGAGMYYASPDAVPFGPAPFGPAPFGPATFDPMAPVALPGVSSVLGVGDGEASRIVGFAGAAGPAIPVGSIPLGKAVAPEHAPASKPPAPLVPAGPSVQANQPTPEAVAERRTQALRRNLLIAGVGGGAIALAALFIYANYNGAMQEHAAAPKDAAPADELQLMARTMESALPTGKRVPADKPTPQPSPLPEPAPMPEPGPAPEPMPAPAPMPAEPAPTEPAPAPAPAPESKPEPAPQPKPEPTPEPAPEPMPMPTPTELAALGKALTLGRTALTEQNFDEAAQHISEAESLAKLPEHKAMAARLKEVADYVQQFRKAVEAASLEFEAGESFKVGTSTQVAVVEATREKIIIRTAGQNKVYPYADLPPGLAVAIADFKLAADDPVSRVLKGSFYAVARGDRQTLVEKAKTWWEEAQLGGADVAPIMPFLSDDYDLVEAAKKKTSEAAKPAESKE